MVAAISSIKFPVDYVDTEYMRIVLELRKLGITPSGNKEIDKAKLKQAKEKLINKIKTRINDENTSDSYKTTGIFEDEEYAKRAKMEEQRLGAMTVAELNRLYFGI